MFNINFEQLMGWMLSFIFPFFRIGAMFMTMPTFGGVFVSQNIRLMFTIAVTLAAMPMLKPVGYIDPISIKALIVIFHEITIGLLISFVTKLAFEVFVVGGHVISLQTGLGFAMLADPQTGISVPSMSRLLSFGTILTFLALDGHLTMIKIVVDSFNLVPVGHSIEPSSFNELVMWGRQLYRGAVIITVPLIAALLIVNILFGVLGRLAPSLNIMSVGFPFTLNFGLFLIAVGMPAIVGHMPNYLEKGFELTLSLLRSS